MFVFGVWTLELKNNQKLSNLPIRIILILHIFASIKCSNQKLLEKSNIEYCPFIIKLHFVFNINHRCQLHLFNLKGKLRRKFKTWLQHKSNCLLHSELHKSSFKKVYFIYLLGFLRILKYSYGSLQLKYLWQRDNNKGLLSSHRLPTSNISSL